MQFGNNLASDFWAYSDGNLSVNGLTYGQLQKLGSKFSHLSYLAYSQEDDAQLASDLGDAGMAAVNPVDRVVPMSILRNSVYKRLTNQQVPLMRLMHWANAYVTVALADCANGG